MFTKIMLPMILIMCFSAAAILSITEQLFNNTYEQQIKSQNDDSCLFISQSVQSFMNKAYAITEELAYSDAILTMDHDIQTPIVEGTAARNDYFELIYIQDMNGDQTARSTGELGNRANRWWFIQMQQQNQPFVSKSYYSVNTNMACASIFLPLVKKNKTIGILATDIKLTTLQSLIEEFSDIDSGKISYILDGEGTIVAHPESIYYEELYNYKNLTKTVAQKDADGQILYDEQGNIRTEEYTIDVSEEYANMIASVMKGDSNFTEVIDNGRTYYASYAPVKLDGISDSWSVVTLQDKQKAMSLMNHVNHTGILITIAAVVLSLLIISLLTRTITKPIQLSQKRLKLLSEGDLTSVVPNIKGKDEIAQLLNDLNKTISILWDIIHKMNLSVQKVAEGDFSQTTSNDFKGEFNILASSLNTIIGSISKTLYQIHTGVNQFMEGLSVVDEATQSLAEGTVSQAIAVQQLSCALSDVSKKITENADNSKNADQMILSVQRELQQGNRDLEELTDAMNAIEANALEINNINVIMQNIASKTNLLSMNASVEAARAGEAGKGVAVVASEIRTLAAQCSEAAVNISELLDKTKKSVQNGMENLKVTISFIQSVHDGSDHASELLSQISTATTEQSKAITQINASLTQITEVTQNNSETAMESAQASLQMKEQAEQLKQLLSGYRYEI